MLRVLAPHPNILAFYDGRVPGQRFAGGSNWVDDGALSLGVASYAIFDGTDALVYDTHISKSRAQFIRQTLDERGVKNITVVLSHWHLDHIAGNEIFKDCAIWSSKKTLHHLAAKKRAIESGTLEGPPGIVPLVLPNWTYEGRIALGVGRFRIELIEFNIHSDDASALWLADERLLLAGDTLEDTVTYVAEPENLAVHLSELDRMSELRPLRILPSHGDPDRIAAGGYGPEFIAANAGYVRALLDMKTNAPLREAPLRSVIARQLAERALIYYEGYEAVHRANVKAVCGEAREDMPEDLDVTGGS